MKSQAFGRYIVAREGTSFYAIYKDFIAKDYFITHRAGWNGAVKVAKMLNEAFNNGREYERSE